MVAVLGGLGGALAFSVTTLCYSRASRMLGPAAVTAWVMVIGLGVAGPVAAYQGLPGGLDAGAIAWLATSGGGNVAGLLFTNAALRRGKVGVVAPIVSTEGAIAALISVAAGEHLSAGAAAMLVIVAAGIVLAGASGETAGPAVDGSGPILLAVAAACAFAASLYATGRVGGELPLFWAVLPARLVGVAVVALPLVAVSRRLPLTRPALPLVVAAGLCEVAGFASFTLGSRHGLAVSAVLTSQFGGMAAVIAFLLFRERLRPVQVGGVALIVAGVAVLTALQA